MTPLKPCPFCGHRPLAVSRVRGEGLWWISCTHCEADMSHGVKETCVAQWNNRVPDPDALRAELDAANARIEAIITGNRQREAELRSYIR